MKKSLLKPLAFAVALSLCGAAAAATDTFNIQDLNSKIDPCSDFNGFVNAKWVAANPIPADRTRWGSFDALREDSLKAQRAIVEAAANSAAEAIAGL